ncbi:MAG: hypothetical protein ACI9F9_000660 [Candidatus Paceibacteria bacterium]|jgi:hypothetical protein
MGIILSFCLVSLGVLHPGSFSRSAIDIEGATVEHTLRVQVLSLIEALPVDSNEDLELDAEELETYREVIAEYLQKRYELRSNGAQEPMSLRVMALDVFRAGSPALPSSAWLQLIREGEFGSPISSLEVTETLFDDSEPNHIEYASVAWGAQFPEEFVFYPGEGSHSFAPRIATTGNGFMPFLELGLHHILNGYDHLLFLLALLVGVRNVRALALVITAFTLAHSVTLAAAALDLVHLPGQFVELAIALSIVYVALENLLGIERRSLWVEALVFGLLHGLGFAGFLMDALAGQESVLIPLLGFNLGVELGQILAVLPLAIIFALRARGKRVGDAKPERLVPAALGRTLSLFVAAFGFYWFLERAGFL